MDTIGYINQRIDAIGPSETDRACSIIVGVILLLFVAFFEEIIESRVVRRWLAPFFGG